MRPFTPQRATRTAALALFTSVLLAACGSSSSSSSASASGSGSASSTTTKAARAATAPTASGHLSVSISGFAYKPATITVQPGTKVTFTNHDQTAHTATSTKTDFDTGTVAPGRSATVTLKKPGTYTYFCQFHAFMHGTVIVR